MEQTGEGAAVAAPSSETRAEVTLLAKRAVAAWHEFDDGDGSEQAYEDALAEFQHVASPWFVLGLLDGARRSEQHQASLRDPAPL